MHCCGAPCTDTTHGRSGLAEQVGRVDQLLGHLAQAKFFPHRKPSQRVIRLVLGEPALRHQQAFGALHQGALAQLQVQVREIGSERVSVRGAHDDKIGMRALDGERQVERRMDCRDDVEAGARQLLAHPHGAIERLLEKEDAEH